MQGEQRKCRHCGENFTPDARNAHHQRYCTAPSCRAASKRASQAKWLAKPENRDYYRRIFPQRGRKNWAVRC